MPISDQDIERILSSFEDEPPEIGEFYNQRAESDPVFVNFLTNEDTGLLTDEEHEYLLFLGMILYNVADLSAIDIEELSLREDKLWEQINDTNGWSISYEADIVPDDDAWGIFLVDALAEDDENAFLTEEGRQVLWVKLRALERQKR